MLRLLSVRVLAATLVGLAAGAGGGFALAGSISAPAQKAAALNRLASVATTDSNTSPAPAPTASPQPIPAQMLGTDAPVPIAPSIVEVRNGWLVSDDKTLVAVYAGAAGNDASVGRVVVVRQNLVAGRQTAKTIDAGSTGALVITAAPLGRAVESSAQRGRLRLRTADGRFLTLDLGTNTVSRDAHGTPLP
ncbi:MAG TPA: hypothetical protein VJ838_16825 [Gaiellaceae bacterium]|nr:hypothetical protein [Gaiellaceae bacterium]